MRVLLAGGGSGGSATPLLAIAAELRRCDPAMSLLYVGTRNGPEMQLAAADGLRYVAVSAGKLRRYWSTQNLTDPFRVTAGLAESLGHVRGFRPDVALGAGGFASVPPLLAASLTGVPVLVHQQDVVPGLANRMLVPFARRITVAMPQTLAHFPRRRTCLRGNPVRPSVLAGDPTAIAGLGLESQAPLVLVTGGGTGALRLNQIVAEAAPALLGLAQVLHLTGRGRGVAGPDLGRRYQQREFLVDEMPDALAAASIVVSRAGMGTLSELAALGKPTIIVPMPSSHQEANAAAFEERAAAVVCHEPTLTAGRLVCTVRELLADEARRRALGAAMTAVMPRDATERLADEVTTLAHRQPRPS